MTGAWKFSKSSQALLKQFIEAPEEHGRNKWVQKFGHNTTELLEKYNLSDLKKECVSILISSDESSSATIRNEGNDQSDEKKIDNLGEKIQNETEHFNLDSIITDPVSHIDDIVKVCLNDINSYNLLVNNLSESATEKLLDHILNNELDSTFTEKILMMLLPMSLKRGTSRHSIGLLLKMKQHYLFKQLLKAVINCTDIQNIVIEEYIAVLKTNTEKADLLNDIISFNISNEAFMHHIYTILTIYKDSNKTKEINNFIMTKLINTAQDGCTDKNYGRLLHLYLQNLKNYPIDAASFASFEELIKMHHSPFRKPCMTLYDNIKSQKEL